MKELYFYRTIMSYEYKYCKRTKHVIETRSQIEQAQQNSIMIERSRQKI